MGNNPVRMLETVSPERLQEASENASYLTLYGQIFQQFDDYMKDKTPAAQIGPPNGLKWAQPVAYFSTEYGLHESLPIYSGGLGTLSGDHLKTASDLNIPLVGVGLLYKNGFFRQVIDKNGDQIAEYPENDFSSMPVQIVQDDRGDAVQISLDLPGTDALCQHLGGPGRTRLPLPSGHRRPAQHPPGPEDHGAPLLRRTADADRAGDPPRDGGRPAPQEAGDPPPRLPHQRGALGLSALRADRLPDDGGGALLRRGERGRPRKHRLYDPHAGGGGKRTVQQGADRILLRQFREVDGDLLVPVLGAGAQGERRREALLHDDPGPQDGPQEQRRQPPARAGLPADVAGRLEGIRRNGHPDRPRHQRRPCPLLHRPPDEGAARHLSRHGLGPPHQRSRTVEARPGHPRHGPLADALRDAAEDDRFPARRSRPQLDEVRLLQDLAGGALRQDQPGGPDDRLRPALRPLQAGGHDPLRPGPPGPDPEPPHPAGPPHLCRQVPSQRRDGKGSDQKGDRRLQGGAVPGEDLLRRGVRHPDRPPPRPGGGRLAEQPPPPPGGERHQRREGGHQRRPEPEHLRRLVGRGV